MKDEAELLKVADLARLFNTTESGIRSALCDGKDGITIPQSMKIGDRRVWLRGSVMEWLEAQAKAQGQGQAPKRGRGRPRKTAAGGAA